MRIFFVLLLIFLSSNLFSQQVKILGLDKDTVTLENAYTSVRFGAFKKRFNPQNNTIITNNVKFENCIFVKNADFSYVTFKEFLSNTNNFVYGATFLYSVFDSITHFSDTFSDRASFRHSKFYYKTDFTEAVFLHGVEFENAILYSSLRFNETHFYGKANFSNLKFKNNAVLSFRDSKFPDTVDFSYIDTIPNEINLLEIAFDSTRIENENDYKPYNLIVYKSDISKLKLDYSRFKLLTEDRDGKELKRDQAISLYETLLKNFNDRGQKESAEKLDIEYQQYKWQTEQWYLRWVGVLSDYWWKFGYAKERVVFWTIGLYLFFFLITFCCLRFLQNNTYKLTAIKAKTDRHENPYSCINRVWYSLAYTGTLFFRLTFKTDNIEFNSKGSHALGTIYVIIVYIVGTICLAYLARMVLG